MVATNVFCLFDLSAVDVFWCYWVEKRNKLQQKTKKGAYFQEHQRFHNWFTCRMIKSAQAPRWSWAFLKYDMRGESAQRINRETMLKKQFRAEQLIKTVTLVCFFGCGTQSTVLRSRVYDFNRNIKWHMCIFIMRQSQLHRNWIRLQDNNIIPTEICTVRTDFARNWWHHSWHLNGATCRGASGIWDHQWPLVSSSNFSLLWW